MDPETLEPVGALNGPALLVIAARVGEVRLIDNVTLDAGRPPGPARSQELACSA